MTKRWKTIAFVAAFLAVAAATGASAKEAHLYVAPNVTFADLTGDGHTTFNGSEIPFDVDHDLDASGRDTYVGLDLFARLGRHRIVAAYSQGNHTGDTSGATGLQFDNFKVAAGKLDSKIELSRRKLLYGFSFLNSSLVDFGVLIGSDGYDVSTKLSQSGGSKKLSINSPAPAIGVNLGIRPPVLPLRFYGEAVYAGLKISNVDTKLTDAYVAVDWYLIPVLKVFGLQAGYRYYDLEADDKDQGAKFSYKYSGPFAGLVFRF